MPIATTWLARNYGCNNRARRRFRQKLHFRAKTAAARLSLVHTLNRWNSAFGREVDERTKRAAGPETAL